MNSAPATKAFAIAPADTDLATPTRGLWVGTAGDLSVIMSGDTDPVTFAGVAAGTLLPLSVKQVRSTGTTAGGIRGVY